MRIGILPGLITGITELFIIIGVWIKYGIFSIRTGGWKQWAGTACLGILTVSLNMLLFGQDRQSYVYFNIMAVYTILTIAAGIDFQKKIIPNVIVGIGFAVRAALLCFECFVCPENIRAAFLNAAAGFAFGLLFLLLLSFITRHGIGYGDVKLFAWIGFSMGFADTYSILFYSALSAAVAGLWLILVKKKDRKTELPFGPFVYIGVYLVMCMAFLGS